jgi:peptidoglycan/LPS O-acetylase OafA/YrhL
LDSPLAGSRRIPQLDGLRGVAIAMVVVFHYSWAEVGVPPRFPGPLASALDLGWAGVDLFFVLSGFLIGGILLDARESPNYFRVFYRRRVCRIFPAYFAFLIVFLLAAHFTRSPEVQRLFTPAIPWPAVATFTQNFWMAIHNQEGAVALNPTWSLAVEEQFYLTLPAIIYFVKPRSLMKVLAGGIVLAPLIRMALLAANPRLDMSAVILFPCRMDPLLFGVVTAYFLRQPGAWEFVRGHRRQLWTSIELLTGVCALFLFSPSRFSTPMILVGYDCLGLLFTATLVAALVDEAFARFLQVKWLMSLGTISYCVYLIHELVFGLTYDLLKDHTRSWGITAILALALTIVIASLSWEYFEKPLVRLGHRERYEPAVSLLSRVPCP